MSQKALTKEREWPPERKRDMKSELNLLIESVRQLVIYDPDVTRIQLSHKACPFCKSHLLLSYSDKVYDAAPPPTETETLEYCRYYCSHCISTGNGKRIKL